MALYKKGESGNLSGRPKGCKNKVTKDIKSCYLEVFDRMGGAEGLLKWAEENPEVFYGQMAKMLPKGIEIKSDQELTINIITAIPEPLPLPDEFAKKPKEFPELRE
jgi:hypothetical protein